MFSSMRSVCFRISPRIHDLALIVDTRGSGNEDLFPVAIGYSCPPLESHSVFVCRIQVGGSIEELDLSGLQAFYGISIHLDKNVRIGMASFYSRTGNIMGLFRQVLRDENLFTGLDDAGIIDIHVLNEEPGTDAIVCQLASLLGQLQDESFSKSRVWYSELEGLLQEPPVQYCV